MLLQSDSEGEESDEDGELGTPAVFTHIKPIWKRVRTYKAASDVTYELMRAISQQDEPREVITEELEKIAGARNPRNPTHYTPLAPYEPSADSAV